MTPPVVVDGERLLWRLDELARLTATPGEGVTREAWSRVDVEARDRVAGWMRDAGLHPIVDPAANLIGRSPGVVGRWFASGSHLDTVVHGGHLDGAYGVVAALEAASALHDAGHTMDHGLLVAAFANEEGARGTAGMTGSYACVGGVSDAALDEVDDEGVTVRDRIAGAGGDPGRIAEARWDPADIDAFVELHIEQGPVLADAEVGIGVVTGITGRQALDLRIAGAANHAGTTPMRLRRDALAAAAEIVLAVEAMPADGAVRVATCGFVDAVPNVRNVVPGLVHLGVEVRDESAAALDAAVARLDALLTEVAARRGVGIDRTWGQRVPPRDVAPAVADGVRRAAAVRGLAHLDLPSGAGHDAQVLADALPMGMIFVPSTSGVSHAPGEHTEPADLVSGAQVLVDTLLDLDARLGRAGLGVAS
ncbi:MAG: Zn-dependent hydrolase [Actinobacteria bacterium]|nr:Zn-dependent hydrolase [Actinomycetota bacterium]